jgi:excisionase family DNA binding protein
MNSLERLYTVDETAQHFQVTRAAVYNWMKAGKLRFVYVGSSRRIPESALHDFIRESTEKETSQSGKTTAANHALA